MFECLCVLSPQRGPGQRRRSDACGLDGEVATAESTLIHTAVFPQNLLDVHDKCRDLDLNTHHSLTSQMDLSTRARTLGASSCNAGRTEESVLI